MLLQVRIDQSRQQYKNQSIILLGNKCPLEPTCRVHQQCKMGVKLERYFKIIYNVDQNVLAYQYFGNCYIPFFSIDMLFSIVFIFRFDCCKVHIRVYRCEKGRNLCVCGIVIMYRSSLILVDKCSIRGGDRDLNYYLHTSNAVPSDIKILEGRQRRLIQVGTYVLQDNKHLIKLPLQYDNSSNRFLVVYAFQNQNSKHY